MELEKYIKEKPKLINDRFVDIVTGDDFKLENCMKNINIVSEKELYEYISKNYSYILGELFGEAKNKYKSLLNNPKFLFVLNQALADKEISYTDLIKFNDYIYTNIIFQNTDSFIRGILFSLGETINKKTVYELSVLGSMDHELCIFIAITYKSSFKDYINVKRINFTLCNSSKKILTVNDIIKIYYTLYSNSFTSLFLATMFDKNIQDAEDNGEEWVTNQESIINDNITTAIIYLLETMNPSDISRVLRKYYDEFKSYHNSDINEVRTSIRTVCTDRRFVKIPILLQELDGQGIIIP